MSANSNISGNYHGVKPVTDDDKDMAANHLKQTLKAKADVKDMVQDKIDDHKKALTKALKDGNKRSANYNRSHMEHHKDEVDDIDKEQDKLHKSVQTLSSLRTHSRRTYNQVRNAKVKLMYRKAGAK